ncbi:glycosyltransferase family 4 protein [Shewanella gaetbuli]
MKKVLIIYNYILHYRKPFFNELAKKYDVTVLHSGSESVTDVDNYVEIIKPARKVGPFMLQKGVFSEVSNEKYDVIISLFDVRWLNILFYLLKKDHFKKHVLWGAWVTNSSVANFLRVFFMRRADANVFYTYEALADFSKYGIPENKMYVGNNTFDVGERVRSFEHPIKNRILFVGSLNKRKQNDILLKGFSTIIKNISPDIIITIVGEGSERKSLEELVSSLGLDDRVQFEGAINDTNILKKLYLESIVSVSFGQAGLAVLQSMGYGVPFLTKFNAISGGEKSNIKPGVNGVFCKDTQESFEEELLNLCNDIEYSRNLGKSAFEHYSEFCTIENMTQGFIDAIEGSRLAKVDQS